MLSQNSEWVTLLNVNESPLDHPLAVSIHGNDIIIFRYGGHYVAMDRWCPHQNGDLGQGRVLGKAIKCPLHGFMFSVETGRGTNCGGFSVRVHEIQLENGLLSVRLNC